MEPLDVPVLAADGGFTLRPWTMAEPDLELVREAAEDELIPLITTVPAAYSRSEGIAFVERQWQRALTRTGYPFVIEAADGRPVGNIGLWLRNLSDGRASLGYWVVASARGRRAAGAGLDAVARWALTELGIPRLELYVEPWNEASWRTAERVGFTREGLLRGWQLVGTERRDMFMYSLLATDGG
ncbi:GNAT family N-acetyltransferase [Streptacidiphilus jiangxiensis]|uniref:Protein N-acetyltransferase, RimJ/RimL family n=1 Tax=Streptacidiphilus jiangxiensis TaxID=235985 RepID=A0A1H7MTQ0_STRJI|nr:GNAT family protein [Streptacidiphilus jiangxiensis]SEL14594.1 Protein N-acetyltransferase, RimJ/RimL family [Streptacidiphilus jiangxiensis]